MRFYSEDTSCWLFEIDDLEGTGADADPSDLAVAQEALAWARCYLCEPHPELGRPGSVCPFVHRSIALSLFFCNVRRGTDIDAEAVCSSLMRYRDWFVQMEPREGISALHKSFLLLFPDIVAGMIPALIDATQERMKPLFVQQGLMVGQFHQLPPKNGGLWNPDFRPLRSSISMLVIRHMVPSDLPFLINQRELVDSYLTRFGHRLSNDHRALLMQFHPQALENLPATVADKD